MTTITEQFASRQVTHSRDGRASSIDILYHVHGTSSEEAAMQALQNHAPAVWGTGTPRLQRQTIEIEPVTTTVWAARVRYDTSASIPTEEDSFEFDTTGEVEHITQSLATMDIRPPGGPDFLGAIAVSDSTVEGVDIVAPAMNFSITRNFTEVSPAYQSLLAVLTGCVNSTAFSLYAPGEVLFLGATGRKLGDRTDFPWSLTYRFKVRPNRSNFTVGDIAVPFQAGWDHMWVRYKRSVSIDGSEQVKIPSSVHIERVYRYADLGQLGIGAGVET